MSAAPGSGLACALYWQVKRKDDAIFTCQCSRPRDPQPSPGRGCHLQGFAVGLGLSEVQCLWCPVEHLKVHFTSP